ncbi:hypothetical protein [Streptomyces sp. NPDC020362]|uniref:hypothetical protein n=1 Tax=unclassified Streptomyces TaxID=2593676 RepID=UPI000AD9181B
MRKFQRAALTAAVVAGLSTLGVGVGHADDSDDPQQVSVVASAQADAVVTWGAAPDEEQHSDSHATRRPAKKHEDKRQESKGHAGKRPAAKNEDKRPAAKGHEGKGQESKGHEEERPVVKKHEGKRPAAKGHEGKGQESKKHEGKRPVFKKHEHTQRVSRHVHERWVFKHSHSHRHGAGIERFSSTSVAVQASGA